MLIQTKKYALIVPSSMGVRITPTAALPVESSDTFFMQATSAETNVASICSYLGLPCKVLTAFVKGSPIAEFIKRNLRSRGMEYEGREVEAGGPWGYRHQFNIADSGFGVRGPRVCNDRAGEVGRTLCAGDFDLDRIFCEEGASVLHLSGLIAALSPSTSEFCVALAKKAKENGTVVSFDLNYRASFWQGRESELRASFTEICSLADILVGNEEDFQLCLGIDGPAAGGKELAEKIDSFKEMIERVRGVFPSASCFATTLRQAMSASSHLWGAVLLSEGQWHTAPPREIAVLDRIGGGDGFVGGLLYAVIRGMNPQMQLQFAWSCGALAASLPTDYAQPTDENQIFNIWNGNARVIR